MKPASDRRSAPPAEVLASILEGLPLAVFVLAGDGTPVYANAAADALLGKPGKDPASPDDLAIAYGAVQAGTGRPYPVQRMPIVRALAGETATVDDMELERPLGTVAVEVWAAPILASDSTVAYAAAAFHDISERRRAQDRAVRLHDETVRQSRWLLALRQIQETVLSGADTDDVLDLVVRRAGELIHGDSTSIGVPDGSGLMAIRAAAGQGAASLTGARFSAADSIMGEVAGMAAAAVLDDIGCHGTLSDPVVGLGLGPAVFVPLGTEGQILGSLCVARQRGGALFTEDEVAAAEAFANQAAMAVRTGDAQRESAHLVVDRDRARTAEDLQDILESLLSARERLSEPPDKPRSELLDRAILQLGSQVNALRPATPPATGPQKELLDLVAQFEGRTGIVTVLHIDGEALGALEAQSSAVLHVVGEALSNVGSRAAARTCRVAVLRAREGLLVQVFQDGEELHVPAAPGAGGGLDDLADAAQRLGGRLDVRAVPGQGSSVTVVLPT